jgi:hypothetical protein
MVSPWATENTHFQRFSPIAPPKIGKFTTHACPSHSHHAPEIRPPSELCVAAFRRHAPQAGATAHARRSASTGPRPADPCHPVRLGLPQPTPDRPPTPPPAAQPCSSRPPRCRRPWLPSSMWLPDVAAPAALLDAAITCPGCPHRCGCLGYPCRRCCPSCPLGCHWPWLPSSIHF